MKKMFLCSSFKDSYSLLSDFAGESLKGKRVTFFPTASAVEEVTHYALCRGSEGSLSAIRDAA